MRPVLSHNLKMLAESITRDIKVKYLYESSITAITKNIALTEAIIKDKSTLSMLNNSYMVESISSIMSLMEGDAVMDEFTNAVGGKRKGNRGRVQRDAEGNKIEPKVEDEVEESRPGEMGKKEPVEAPSKLDSKSTKYNEMNHMIDTVATKQVDMAKLFKIAPAKVFGYIVKSGESASPEEQTKSTDAIEFLIGTMANYLRKKHGAALQSGNDTENVKDRIQDGMLALTSGLSSTDKAGFRYDANGSPEEIHGAWKAYAFDTINNTLHSSYTKEKHGKDNKKGTHSGALVWEKGRDLRYKDGKPQLQGTTDKFVDGDGIYKLIPDSLSAEKNDSRPSNGDPKIWEFVADANTTNVGTYARMDAPTAGDNATEEGNGTLHGKLSDNEVKSPSDVRFGSELIQKGKPQIQSIIKEISKAFEKGFKPEFIPTLDDDGEKQVDSKGKVKGKSMGLSNTQAKVFTPEIMDSIIKTYARLYVEKFSETKETELRGDSDGVGGTWETPKDAANDRDKSKGVQVNNIGTKIAKSVASKHGSSFEGNGKFPAGEEGLSALIINKFKSKDWKNGFENAFNSTLKKWGESQSNNKDVELSATTSQGSKFSGQKS